MGIVGPLVTKALAIGQSVPSVKDFTLPWTIIGSTAEFLLCVYEDLGLVVAGLAGVWTMSRSRSPGPVEPLLGH